MLILAAILAIFVYGMIAAMLGTILPDLSARFQLTPKQNGTIAFCQALGLIVASVAVGPLIDNQGKKTGLVLGLAVITLALVLLPRSTGFGSIATYLLLLGLGGGIIVTAANALASDVTPDRRGTTLNLLNLFFGLGGFATPFISANLLSRNSVRLVLPGGGPDGRDAAGEHRDADAAAYRRAELRILRNRQRGGTARRCGWRPCSCSFMLRPKWACGTGWCST